MSGTLYGYPRPAMYDGVPVVPGSPARTAVDLHPAAEGPGFRPVWAAFAAVVLIDIVLAVLIATIIWR